VSVNQSVCLNYCPMLALVSYHQPV